MVASALVLDHPFRGHVRRQAWERLSHGLYAPARARSVTGDLQAWQLVLPRSAAFSHLTAAELLGWWLPAPIVHPVFVTMASTSCGPRRTGLYVCRHPTPVAVQIVDGLRLTPPAETLLAAARDLDLVIMADSALRLRHCPLTDLQRTARQRRRGAPLLRRVIDLLDPRSESAWESVMRVLHRAAGVPVEPQHTPSSTTTASSSPASTSGWSEPGGSRSTTAPATGTRTRMRTT